MKKRWFQTYLGLPKSVYIVFAAQIINRFGDFVMPFLTLFLTSKLGFSISATGTIVMAATLMTIPGGLLGGKIADQVGRIKTYALFQGAAGLMILLATPFIQSRWVIVLLMASAFFNGAVRPILSAILTDVLPPDRRQDGFSLSYLGINIGVAVGPIAAGFLFNHYLPLMFIGDALTTFIAVVLVVKAIPESRPEPAQSGSASDLKESTLSVLLQRPRLLLFMIFTVFISATYAQSNFSLPIMMNTLFGDQGPAIFGSLISLNAVVVLVMTMFVTELFKNRSPVFNMAFGGGLYAIGFGMIAWITALPLFWISTFIWTIGEILISVSYGVYVAEKTPVDFRARIGAVSNISWAIGALIGIAGMGVFIDSFGIHLVWYVVGVLGALGALGIYSLRE